MSRFRFPSLGKREPGKWRVAIKVDWPNGDKFEASVPHANPLFARALVDFFKEWVGRLSQDGCATLVARPKETERG